jgi:CheY-like chemotaxis protein
MNGIAGSLTGPAKILLIGADRNKIVEKRLQAAGCRVALSEDGPTAANLVRHQSFAVAVLLSKGSLLNAAETVLNLRDLNRNLEIIVLIDRRAKDSDRYLRQLREHPIDGTKIMTRRQLQRYLHAASFGGLTID